MGKLRVLWARVKGQATQEGEDEILDAEIREHIAMLEVRYAARGMSPQEAATAARRQFGNVTVLKERQRAVRGFLSPLEWWRDARFGMRMLAKRPLSNAAVVVALSIGIGMNAAVFTFVNALLLRPPQGVNETRRLVEVWMHNDKGSGVQSYAPFSYPDYVYYRDHTKSLEGLAAFDGDGTSTIWNHGGAGEILHGQFTSGNLFALLGVDAVAGRALTTEDDKADSVRPVMVSYAFWKQKLGGEPGAVGQTLMLNGSAFTVVGVAPAGFTGLLAGMNPDFWAPLAVQERFTHDKGRVTDADSYWLIVAGRLRKGDRNNVQAEMHVLAKQVYGEHGSKGEFQDAIVYPLTLVPGPFRGYVGGFTGMLLAVFTLVLLIACTNAAGLLLARASGRAREMAIRAALGAGRQRLVRQMLVESLLLAGIAGAASVAIASATSRLLMELVPASLPVRLEIPVDWRVVLFTLAASLVTGVVFGLAPALRASAVEAARVLKEESQSGGRMKSRMRRVLIVTQTAACVVLLAGAALCVRSLVNARAIAPGFETRHIGLATLDPGSLGYTPEQVSSFYDRLLERVQRLPGVSSASYAGFLPLGTSREMTSAAKRIAKNPDAMVDVFRVETGFFTTMGIPLLRGRDLTRQEAEAAAPNAIVVNDYLAKKLWPGEDPLGKHLALGEEKMMSEVVGVAANGKYHTLGEGPVGVVFRGQLPAARTLIVRTAGDSRAITDELQRAVPIVDPLMAATQVQTIESYMALPLFPARTTGWLLGVSGILAVVMTAIGLFGLIAYMVSQRTHEIGVRMALGARRIDVMKMVMSQGLGLTATGLAIGLAAAFAAVRLLSPLLYGIGASDPTTMAGVALGLVAVALAACYLPARRAMRVDPAAALRCE